ncbi:MAG: PKD domain-containing protein [Chitinophagales bacterium]|nr:PKD domain-containing protein [Chitinophagales bacterium]
MKSFLPLLFSFLIVSTASAQVNCNSLRYQQPVFDSVTLTEGIKFATATPYGLLAQPQDLFLDFYEPTGDTLSKRPLIIFQFGGGFAIGWRSEPVIPDFCRFFARHGYAVASIDYRLGFNIDSQSTVRAMYRAMQDERAAIRFLSANATQYRIDTNFIFLTGTSAGCFSALGNCFMSEADRPASTYGYTLEPNDLGCMDCSGNTLFGQRIPKIKAIINQWGAILDTNLIDLADNIPIISFHGDQDLLVPYEYGFPFQLPVFPPVYGSKPIHERLTNLGILNELRPLVGYGHEPELLNAHLNDTIRNYSRDFLFQLLKPNTSAISGPSVICKGKQATYSVSPTAGSKYCWQLSGSGTIIQNNSHSITVLWSDTGTMQVTVKELNYLQAEGTLQTFTTQVVPDVKANFGFVQNELEVLLSNWSVNAENYYWSFGDGTISTDTNPIKNYATGGTYPITLIADNNVCSDTFVTSFTVDSCPVAGFTYQLTNFNGFFYAQPTNTLAYAWYFGDGDSAKVMFHNVVHIYKQAGTYEVTLKVKNALGCEEVYTQTITVTVVSGIASGNEEKFTFHCDQAGNCRLRFEENEGILVEVFDVSGKKTEELLVEHTNSFSLQHLAIGNYIVRCTAGNKAVAKPVTRY